MGWIGVDLDGTLAEYYSWISPSHIGPPIPEMVQRVLKWKADGEEVRIFTARVANPEEEAEARAAIDAWCLEHLGFTMPVTCIKDSKMEVLWDDRCVRVEAHTGRHLLKEAQELLKDVNHAMGIRW